MWQLSRKICEEGGLYIKCFSFPDIPLYTGPGKWLNASAYVSVIRRLVVQPSFILLALTIHLLSVDHLLCPTGATDWFTKGCVMHYHTDMIMHVKDLKLSGPDFTEQDQLSGV